MEKNYIIVGDNNFWYSTFKATFAHEVTAEIEDVKDNIKANVYNAEKPNQLFVYEANLSTTINLSK